MTFLKVGNLLKLYLNFIDGQLVVAGCGDGSVRLFDRRLSQNDARVLTWREHNGWVVNCSLRGNTIISGR